MSGVSRAALLFVLLLAGCSSSPPSPSWESSSRGALGAFQEAWLAGNDRVAAIELARAKRELASTGRPDMVARAELLACALRVASLQFDECAGFAPYAEDAGAELRAYAEYLAGKRAREGGVPEAPLSRLVAAGVKLRNGTITPPEIDGAIDAASSQGWRRPLLAWLGVQEKRAEAAGDREAAAKLRRRIELVLSGR